MRKGVMGIIAALILGALAVAGGMYYFSIAGITKDTHNFEVSVTETFGGGCGATKFVSNSESYYFDNIKDTDKLFLSNISINTRGSGSCAYSTSQHTPGFEHIVGNPRAVAWWDAYCVTPTGEEVPIVTKKEGYYVSNSGLVCDKIKVVLNVMNNQLIWNSVTHTAIGTAKVVGPDLEYVGTDIIKGKKALTYTCDVDLCKLHWHNEYKWLCGCSASDNNPPINLQAKKVGSPFNCKVARTCDTGVSNPSADITLERGETASTCNVANPLSSASELTGCSKGNVITLSVKKYVAVGCGDNKVQLDRGEECDPPGSVVSWNGIQGTCGPDCKIAVCGNGRVDYNEVCDDGNSNNNDDCLNTCQPNVCGDGILNPNKEECDDGNLKNGDGCSSTCKKEVCGDGVIQTNLGEQCDGSNLNGSTCADFGYDGGTLRCYPKGSTKECTFDKSMCRTYQCGNGIVDPGEQCDDGNNNSNDLCVNCKSAFCGDGFVRKQGASPEQCDPGLNNENAKNNLNCPQGTWTCNGHKYGTRDAYGDCNSGCSCTEDNFVWSCVKGKCGATCSDTNFVSGDGCNAQCQKEYCGDGIIQSGLGEQCDGDGPISCTTPDGLKGHRVCQNCKWSACDPSPATGTLLIPTIKYNQPFSIKLSSENLAPSTEVSGEIRDQDGTLIQKVTKVLTTSTSTFSFRAIPSSGKFDVDFYYYDEFLNKHSISTGNFIIKAPMKVDFYFEDPTVQYTIKDLVAYVKVDCGDVVCQPDVTNLQAQWKTSTFSAAKDLHITPSFEPQPDGKMKITIPKGQFGPGYIYLTENVKDTLGNHDDVKKTISSKVIQPQIKVQINAPTSAVVGQTAKISVETLNYQGLKTDVDTLFMDIKYPDGITKITKGIQDFNHPDVGLYELDFTFGQTNEGQAYRFLATAGLEGYKDGVSNNGHDVVVPVIGGVATHPEAPAEQKVNAGIPWALILGFLGGGAILLIGIIKGLRRVKGR